MAILFGSFIVNGQSSYKNDIFTYNVLSITPCTIVNDDIRVGETTYPKDDRTIIITNELIVVYIGKTETKISFNIQDYEFDDDGNLVYETKHRLSGDKVLIMINRDGYSYTFTFLNINEKECYIYETEYFK